MVTSKRRGKGWGRKRLREDAEAALLRNPSRQRILDLLRDRPGMNRRQLARELGINLNGLGYHLERLEQAGWIALRPGLKEGEVICFTSKNVGLWEEESLRVLFGSSRTRDVALFLVQDPCAETRHVAEELGLSVYTVRRHVRRLEESELIRRAAGDQPVRYHVEPELRSWVEVFGRPVEGEGFQGIRDL